MRSNQSDNYQIDLISLRYVALDYRFLFALRLLSGADYVSQHRMEFGKTRRTVSVRSVNLASAHDFVNSAVLLSVF